MPPLRVAEKVTPFFLKIFPFEESNFGEVKCP